MGNLNARPAGSPVAPRALEAADAPLGEAQRADGGYTSADGVPAALLPLRRRAVRGHRGLSIFDREFVMRLWNLPLLLGVSGWSG